MIDTLRIESITNCRSFDSGVTEIGQLFGKSANDLLETYRDIRGFTPIHEAMFSEDRETSLKQALAMGNTIDDPDKSGRTALAWAVEYGFQPAVQTLLDFGANANQRRLSSYTNTSLVHIALAGPSRGKRDAVYLNIAGMLLGHGADVNSRDHEGWTPLHIAASWKSHGAMGVLERHDRGILEWGAVTDEGQSSIDLVNEAGGDSLLQDLVMSKLRSSSSHFILMSDTT